MPITLTDKEQQLLRALFESDGPVTAPALAKLVGVSERTARSRVQAINHATETPCITASRNGYTVDRETALTLLNASEPDVTVVAGVPQTSDERVTWLINRLLRSRCPLNVYDLCEEIFISISTMKNELVRTKRRLARLDLELIQADNSVSVRGTEKNKRRLLSQLLYDEASVNFLDLSTIQRAFPDIDACYLRDCVRETLDEHRYFVNDYSLINLILHIAIAIDRIRNNGSEAAASTVPGASNLRAHEHDMASEIVRRLETRFDIAFSPNEVDELALMLASRTTMLDYEGETRESIRQYVSPETLKLTDLIIGDIESFYYIDLSEREFFVRFALHIKNLLVRANAGDFAKNPLTAEIRSSCPMLYEAAVDVASVIKRERGLSINDDEIAYIAFHLGSTLETQKQLSSKVKTVLYCPAYYNVDKNLQAFLEQHFRNDVLLVAVATDEDELRRATDMELVIATSPMRALLDAPVYQIGIVPREGDVEHIRNLIARIRRDKRRTEFRSHLEQLVLPEFFVLKDAVSTREEAVHTMCGELEGAGYVDPGYEEEIWAREQLSPTAFGVVAVPHALRPHANKSCISVLVPTRPIDWNGTPVKLVLMLSFSLRERSVFNELFDPLVAILLDASNVDALTRATSYQEFIDRLSEMVE